MTNGTSQGLFVIVAVVIFGIFVAISYSIFRGSLQPALANIFKDSLTQAEDSLYREYTDPSKRVMFGYQKKFKLKEYVLQNNLENTFNFGSYSLGGGGSYLQDVELTRDLKEFESSFYSKIGVFAGTVEEYNDFVKSMQEGAIPLLESLGKEKLEPHVERISNFLYKKGFEEKIVSFKIDGKEVVDKIDHTLGRDFEDFNRTVATKVSDPTLVDIDYVETKTNTEKSTRKVGSVHDVTIGRKFKKEAYIREESTVFKIYTKPEVIELKLQSGREYKYTYHPFIYLKVDRVEWVV